DIFVGKVDEITPEICASSIRVIEAWIDTSPCPIFDFNALKESGALAGYYQGDGAIKWQTTRAVTGRRLWNDRSVRHGWDVQ
ncbi:MAG: hypothetical protein ACPGRD_12120, partial [Planktomarina sp.]